LIIFNIYVTNLKLINFLQLNNFQTMPGPRTAKASSSAAKSAPVAKAKG
jgi:hypothetical protein